MGERGDTDVANPLKYTECPCLGCAESLPLNEKIKYGSVQWADWGRCPICDKFYCGNPECALRLVESKSGNYVQVLNPTGSRYIMVCEACGWEHIYLGGQPPVISDPTPPAVTDRCPSHHKILLPRPGREFAMQSDSTNPPVLLKKSRTYGCPETGCTYTKMAT